MPKGVRLTREAEVQRRRQIVGVAAHLIAEKGAPAVSMRQIAAAAGAGKSTLYDYFAGREDIVAAVYEAELARAAAGARETARLPLPATERLVLILTGRLRMGRTVWQQAALPGAARRRLRARAAEFQEIVAEVIRQGIDEGALRAVDPVAAARAALGATEPAPAGEASGAEEEGAGRTALEIVLRGLASQPAATAATEGRVTAG